MTDEQYKKYKNHKYVIKRCVIGEAAKPALYWHSEEEAKEQLEEMLNYNKNYDNTHYYTRTMIDWHTGELKWMECVVESPWGLFLEFEPEFNEYGEVSP